MIYIEKYPFKRFIAASTIAGATEVAKAVAPAVAGGIAQGSMNRATRKWNEKQAEKQQAWNEKMFNETNAWNLEMWNKQNEYNTPTAQLERLRDAGLNPLFYGLDGTGNAGDVGSAQALGYERANASDQTNPIAKGVEMFSNIRGLQKDIELKNAQIDKLNEETDSVKLDNEWKDKTMDARVEAEKLANDKQAIDIKAVKQSINESKERVKKLIEETKNEVEKRGLIAAQTILNKAQADEIAQLLPYKKLLVEAQTQAQKAAAAASFTHAAYEQGLIDSGYIDKMCEDMEASIRQKYSAAEANEAAKALNEWKTSVRTGNVYDLSEVPNWQVTKKISQYLANELFSFTSALSESVGGGLSGFIK